MADNYCRYIAAIGHSEHWTFWRICSHLFEHFLTFGRMAFNPSWNSTVEHNTEKHVHTVMP